ncbi:MAG: GAF domain-containing protein [bacterium]|nr:GAF domain-containing protein [bacterium]
MEPGDTLEELRSLYELERKRAETLARVSESIVSSLDLHEILRTVLNLAVEVMAAERGFLMLADEGQEKLELAIAHNLEHEQVERDEDLRVSRSIVERVFATGQPVITTDAQSDPRFNLQHSIVTLHIRSIVCVPLKVRSRIVGVVYLDSRVLPGLFNRRDPALLQSFTNQAAMAIENARLYERQRAQLSEITALRDLQANILESIASGVVTLDEGGHLTTFNRAAERTFGITSDAMLGKEWRVLEALIPGIGKLLETFGASGKQRTAFEAAGRHPMRGALVLQLTVAPLTGPNGDPTGLALLVADRTEQRALEMAHAEQLQRSRRVEETFSRYLAPHVVQALVHDPEGVQLGGERCTATMLFADIRGFTRLSSQMEPERVVELLNTYLERAVSVVFEHYGLLDKFYGDGVMAIFGPPRVRRDDAKRALETAVALQRVVRELDGTFTVPLEISCGVATGEVVAGNIGSSRRMEYTVIGDAVNLAARLQAAAPPRHILCDETTYMLAQPQYEAERMLAKIKGRDEPVTVFDISPEAQS